MEKVVAAVALEVVEDVEVVQAVVEVGLCEVGLFFSLSLLSLLLLVPLFYFEPLFLPEPVLR